VDPFETLLDIERNCKAYAVNIPRKIVTKRDWFGIGFRSSNFNFVCPIKEVIEILRGSANSEVPGAYPWFRGVSNLRGHLLPVTDLEGFITGVVHPENGLSRILVVSFENALYGFVVSQLLGIERFFGKELKSAEKIPEIKQYLPFVQGTFEQDRKPWVILSFRSLIKTPEFYHVVKGEWQADV